jgi:hypothetical protein
MSPTFAFEHHTPTNKQPTTADQQEKPNLATDLDIDGLVPLFGSEGTAPLSPLDIQCSSTRLCDPLDAGVGECDKRVPGFSRGALSNLTVLQIGAGAIGCEIADSLVCEGVGTLKIVDFGTVGLPDLKRRFFGREEIDKPKSWALARNLQRNGQMGTRIIAWNVPFEDAPRNEIDLDCDLVISAVNGIRTPAEISRFARERGIPALFASIPPCGGWADLFIQEIGGACIGCAFTNRSSDERTVSPESPEIEDPFRSLAELALLVIDSLVMDRPRQWNLHMLYSLDAELIASSLVHRHPDCPLCGDDE